MRKNSPKRRAGRQGEDVTHVLARTWAPLNRDELVLVRHGLLRVSDSQAVSVWTARRLMATLDAIDARGSTVVEK